MPHPSEGKVNFRVQATPAVAAGAVGAFKRGLDTVVAMADVVSDAFEAALAAHDASGGHAAAAAGVAGAAEVVDAAVAGGDGSDDVMAGSDSRRKVGGGRAGKRE